MGKHFFDFEDGDFAFFEMMPLVARVANMLLQSRKCNSASYSDWVIATPPTETTVYCRSWNSQ